MYFIYLFHFDVILPQDLLAPKHFAPAMERRWRLDSFTVSAALYWTRERQKIMPVFLVVKIRNTVHVIEWIITLLAHYMLPWMMNNPKILLNADVIIALPKGNTERYKNKYKQEDRWRRSTTGAVRLKPPSNKQADKVIWVVFFHTTLSTDQ